MKTELTCDILMRNGFVFHRITKSLTITHMLDCRQESVCIRAYYNYFEDKWMIYAPSFLGYASTVEDMNKLLKRNNIDKKITVKTR